MHNSHNDATMGSGGRDSCNGASDIKDSSHQNTQGQMSCLEMQVQIDALGEE